MGEIAGSGGSIPIQGNGGGSGARGGEGEWGCGGGLGFGRVGDVVDKEWGRPAGWTWWAEAQGGGGACGLPGRSPVFFSLFVCLVFLFRIFFSFIYLLFCFKSF